MFDSTTDSYSDSWDTSKHSVISLPSFWIHQSASLSLDWIPVSKNKKAFGLHLAFTKNKSVWQSIESSKRCTDLLVVQNRTVVWWYAAAWGGKKRQYCIIYFISYSIAVHTLLPQPLFFWHINIKISPKFQIELLIVELFQFKAIIARTISRYFRPDKQVTKTTHKFWLHLKWKPQLLKVSYVNLSSVLWNRRWPGRWQVCPSFPPYPQGCLFHGKKVKERKIYIWYEMQNHKEQIIIEVQ